MQFWARLGEITFTGLASLTQASFSFIFGKSLNTVREQVRSLDDLVRKYQLRHLDLYLRNLEFCFHLLSQEENHETILIRKSITTKRSQVSPFVDFWCGMTQSLTHLANHSYQEAATEIETVIKHLDKAFGMIYQPIAVALGALAHYALAIDGNDNQKSSHIQRANGYQKAFNKFYRKYPRNLKFYHAILCAESAHLNLRRASAENHYEQALQISRMDNMMLHESIAYSRAGIFYNSIGNFTVASQFADCAYDVYYSWGGRKLAFNSVEAKKQKNEDDNSARFRVGESEVGAGRFHTTGLFDAETMQKIFDACKTTGSIENIAEQTLKLAVEYSHAEKGALISEENGKLRLKSYISAIADKQPFNRDDSPDAWPLSQGLVRLAMQKGSTVRLDRDHSQPSLANDAYIIKHRPKNSVAIPIVLQHGQRWSFYLESNRIHLSFSVPQIEFVNLLANQAKLAIESSLLIEEKLRNEQSFRHALEQKVEQRTKELFQAKSGIESSHHSLAALNQKINEGLSYAARLQTSILPSENQLTEAFPSHFVIWKPRELVGGDFYWLRKIDDRYLIALVDCTGHGVPGAFLTMVANTLLNQAAHFIQPSLILEQINRYFTDAITRSLGDNYENEGLDIVVALADPKAHTVTAASSGMNIFHVHDDGGEIIKSGNMRIGRSDNTEALFPETIISAKDSSQFYLISDGLFDQPGGEKGLPFGRKRLLNVLIEAHTLAVDDQQKFILKRWQEFTGEMPQVDDISAIMFKVG